VQGTRSIILPQRSLHSTWFYVGAAGRNDVAVSLATNRNSNAFVTLGHGFEWIRANETISVDLDLKDLNTELFVELLYFT